jgi:hypothetical protein
MSNSEEGFTEEIVRVGSKSWYARWYWLLALWLVTIGVFTGVGYYSGGAKAPPEFLAAVSEAWSNMFASGRGGFVEIIDTQRLTTPITLMSEADRTITGGAGSNLEARPSAGSFSVPCPVDTDDLPARDKIVINEVAWMGGLEAEGLDARDEWVELANISSATVDLGGWRLVDDDGQIDIIFSPGVVVEPGGFLLLERTDDASVPRVIADIIYTGSLSNEDDGLRLFNTVCGLEDEALADPNWPAGEALARRTMERGVDFSWHTFGGSLLAGIYGTPRGRNSEPAGQQVQEEVVEDNPQAAAFSPCSLENLKSPAYGVLINEVAWAGRSDNTSEEWIELYYPDGGTLDLTGWQLLDAEGAIRVQFSNEDSINEYFLLRRILTADDPDSIYTVGGKMVDKTYTGVIQNSDEGLYLFNDRCDLVDKVDGVGAGWKEIGGTASPEYRTAERINKNSWHTYSGLGKNGVMGTPRAVNSGDVGGYVSPTNGSSGGGGEVNPPSTGNNTSTKWCPQDDLNSPTHIVYINEIAWGGTASSTSEEWLEFYTPVAGGLSLKGWQVLDKDGEIKISFGDGERIDDFLLLRRILTEDNPSAVYTVAGAVVDGIYTGVLENDDETLRLFDASCNLVDEVVDVGLGWANIGGTATPDYRTAERTTDGSWQTYAGEGAGGVMGTPGAENSSGENALPTNGGDGGGEGEENPPDDGNEEPPPSGGGEPADLTNLSITEIIFDVEGADNGLERVKISNSGDNDILMETFSLQYLRVGADISAIKKKNFEAGDLIPAGGDFLVGMSCSTAVPCEGVDMSWSQSLANDGGTVYLVSDQENITDASDPNIICSLSYSPVEGGG